MKGLVCPDRITFLKNSSWCQELYELLNGVSHKGNWTYCIV